jgi:peroxiredoxin
MFIDVMLVLILVSLWVGLYQVVKQHGRILLRLDQLERQRPVENPESTPSTLAVGTPFPTFRYRDLAGRMLRLEELQPKQTLLVHWSPDCGFCEMIAGDLAGLQEDFQKHEVELVLLAHGDAATNRKLADTHGLSCPILLLDGKDPCQPLQSMGTPIAYLLDREGRVAQPCAVGFDEVIVLARSATGKATAESPRSLPGAQPLSESQILRDGLKAGTTAPTFRLPNIHGGMVSLNDYRGRPVLLLFSDPHCGPCDALLPELVRFDREHRNSGPQLILVGRGDWAENRQKAEQFGIQFPVVLQDKWKLSKEYGIFATPVAFLIDENGILQQNVAVGAEAITALAREALNPRKDYESALSA